MQPHWIAHKNCLEIASMPFYWRLSDRSVSVPGIEPRMPVRLKLNAEFDYLELALTATEQAGLDLAYRQDANIGFINPESGQIDTYGASVNAFFLESVQAAQPKKIFEIGCGAGFSIEFMRQRGWQVTGIDPSEYSLRWSKRLGFELINQFFDVDAMGLHADFVFCNDVFEHVGAVVEFSRNVCKALVPGGTFAFATTNSTQSIMVGDISMLEHQHVNMFTETSIGRILRAAGFNEVRIDRGSYGNTFHVVARKGAGSFQSEEGRPVCDGYFERAQQRIEAFAGLYSNFDGRCGYYAPLRCIPYLATVGDFGEHDLFDSNPSWHDKFIDGYARPIRSPQNIVPGEHCAFFVGSTTFFEEIRKGLVSRGVAAGLIHGVGTLV
ncbi:class I SAM-dependent methyltransferase [Metapseudomonas resinovorans]|uniref:class I SAM-dependent methyltransferase n=1 Tax=Metapseudomonas resinovorans TaxID=53412 RepID=UPI00040D1287|nr:class I SAM-dependent methyltransferase [Pseudomonas resinovorans]